MLDNQWGGALTCRADGTYGPWIMNNPERLIGMKPVGDGECVAIAQYTLVMPHTTRWREGEKVLGRTSLEKGTVMATFIDGRYPSKAHGNHVAIFIEQREGYIKVIDQWKGRSPQYRNIIVKEGMTDRSNNANAFSVVYTLPAPPEVPRRAKSRRRTS